MRFTIATYNIHKGFSHLTRKVVIHELKDRLHGLSADILFLQEVQGVHRRHARRYHNWPGKPQHEFIADTVWHEVAYGRNAVYQHGHHGNAVLSHYPIVAQANLDISAHAFESRGLLHCVLQLKRGLPALHCINVHLGLFERGRRWQVHALCERIREAVPQGAPLIVAGDFNDWGLKLDEPMRQFGLRRAGKPGDPPARFNTFPSRLPVFSMDRIYLRGKSSDIHDAAARGVHPAARLMPLSAVLELLNLSAAVRPRYASTAAARTTTGLAIGRSCSSMFAARPPSP